MPTETFLTTLYTIIDDWYQQHAPKLLAGKAGKKPLFCGSSQLPGTATRVGSIKHSAV